MTDYIKAFRDGIKAAEAAELAKRQIDDTFAELNLQISKGSGGNIVIDRNNIKDKLDIFNFPPIPKYHWAIVANNPNIPDSPLKELARWSQDSSGFPCKIEWANFEHTCEDKESLEDSLAELLRDPTVGEILYALTRLEPNTQKEDQSKKQD